MYQETIESVIFPEDLALLHFFKQSEEAKKCLKKLAEQEKNKKIIRIIEGMIEHE
ncbi:MAG: hypothetical protein ACRDCC_08650 [Culicoidibacterales bacterium]